jgi:hypothetical protein
MPRFAVALAASVLALLSSSLAAAQRVVPSPWDITWMQRASLPVPRSDATASVIGTRVWVVGGCKGDNICANATWGVACDCTVLTDNVAIFDTTTNSWSSAPNPMPRNRTRHAAHLVGGRRIYLVGGRNSDLNCVREVDVLDTVTGLWSRAPDLPADVSDNAGYVMQDGVTIVSVGGYDAGYASLSTAWALNTAAPSATWSTNVVPPLRVARGDHSLAQVAGRVYVFGGFNSDAGFCAAMSTMETLVPGAAGWALGNMTFATGDSAVAVLDDQVHLIGGEAKTAACTTSPLDNTGLTALPLDRVNVFLTASASWARLRAIPEERFRFVGASAGGAVYIFGGQKYYNPATSSFPVAMHVWKYVEFSIDMVGSAPAAAAAGLSMAGAASLALAVTVASRALSL